MGLGRLPARRRPGGRHRGHGDPRHPRRVPEAPAAGLRVVLADRTVVRWLASELLANAAWVGSLVYCGALLVEVNGTSAVATGLLLALVAIAYIAGTLALRRWSRLDPHDTLRALALALAAVEGLVWTSASTWPRRLACSPHQRCWPAGGRWSRARSRSTTPRPPGRPDGASRGDGAARLLRGLDRRGRRARDRWLRSPRSGLRRPVRRRGGAGSPAPPGGESWHRRSARPRLRDANGGGRSGQRQLPARRAAQR